MKSIIKIITLLFSVLYFAQTTIRGTDLDNNGLPLPGANIIVIDTSTESISDFDGKFVLTVDKDPPITIQVSSVGFETYTQNKQIK